MEASGLLPQERHHLIVWQGEQFGHVLPYGFQKLQSVFRHLWSVESTSSKENLHDLSRHYIVDLMFFSLGFWKHHGMANLAEDHPCCKCRYSRSRGEGRQLFTNGAPSLWTSWFHTSKEIFARPQKVLWRCERNHLLCKGLLTAFLEFGIHRRSLWVFHILLDDEPWGAEMSPWTFTAYSYVFEVILICCTMVPFRDYGAKIMAALGSPVNTL